MKTTIIIVLALTTGCVYSPTNTHNYGTADGNKSVKKPKAVAEQPYVRYSQEESNEVQVRPQSMMVEPPMFPRLNPHYSPIPRPVNRTVYVVESSY
jgi:hypothetical protein